MEQSALKLINRIGVLCQICGSISSGEILENLDLDIYNLVNSVIPLDIFYFGLFMEKANLLDLKLIMDEGLRYPRVSVAIRKDIVSQAILSRKTMVLNRTEAEIKSLNHDEYDTVGNKQKISKSIIVTPVMIPGRVVGVISVQSYSPDLYSATEVKLMKIICAQIAGSVESAKKIESEINYERNLKVAEENEEYRKSGGLVSLQKDYEKVVLQKDNLQSIVELATMISHEMNQPLTGISGYCALIKEDLEENEPIYNDLKQIQKQARRLEQLITDFQSIIQLAQTDNFDTLNQKAE